MKCKCSKSRQMDGKTDGPEILKSESFWYLGSIIHRGGEIEEDVNHKIRA